MQPQGGPPSAQDAVLAWQGLTRSYMTGRKSPGGSEVHSTATKEEVAELLLQAATGFDQLRNGDALRPGQADHLLVLLLLVRDFVLPLPSVSAGTTKAFDAMLSTLRSFKP